jgi:hypothetical protein
VEAAPRLIARESLFTNRREARGADDMPFMSIDDLEFWKNCPKGLELIPKSMEGTVAASLIL